MPLQTPSLREEWILQRYLKLPFLLNLLAVRSPGSSETRFFQFPP